jgi:plastocyanin
LPNPTTVTGGSHHPTGSLSHAERQAALNALRKVQTSSSKLSSTLGDVPHSATLIGGTAKSPVSTALLHGSGRDTFIGGARSSTTATLGNDTVLSGSAKPEERASSGLRITATHAGIANLGADTINVAGTTAASIKAAHPDEKPATHTVTLGDKTTVTISGLSTHDVTKLHH